MNQSSFKKLQKKWYNKLRASGFEDIEQGDYLKASDKNTSLDEQYYEQRTHSTKYRSRLWKDSQAEYYRMAAQFSHSRFDTVEDRLVWQAHSEGKTNEEAGKRAGVTKREARTIVERLRIRFFGPGKDKRCD
jgi:hypothetical protein